MALNQEENLSSGIKFDSEGFLERCQNAERENPKSFDDSFEIDTNFPGDFFGVGRKIGSLDAAIIRCIEAFDREFCGFKTKETPEAMKVLLRIMVQRVMFWRLRKNLKLTRFDNYWFPWCDAALTRKWLDEDCIRAEKDVTPPDCLLFDLGYLGLVEVVCKLPRDAVQNDPLPWRNIHIDHPLNDKITQNDPLPWRKIHIDHPFNDKITDDDLLRITNRAQGTLHSLSLVECRKITAAGLRRIFLSNPGLSEVSIL
ncbi:unnamed protein product [Fraxinus pennsylvanica]|uniref:Uncharacterized protein n=1 Tax=Fraxinus pennsylvanica TaxID=56036 RepID=A0AAD2DWT1_9LAMI|nr:unnamed protein product [Fraxinus pennsylvanica]